MILLQALLLGLCAAALVAVLAGFIRVCYGVFDIEPGLVIFSLLFIVSSTWAFVISINNS
jgi:hypothetical protein